MPLYYINTGEQEVIKLELVTHAGSHLETTPGSSFFASKMLAEGTVDRSSAEIAEQLDFYGAQLDISPGFDFASTSIYLLRDKLPQLLPLISEILTLPAFDQNELEIQKSLKADAIKVNLEKNQFVASRKIRETLFGDQHSYGHSLELAHVEAIDQQKVKSFYEEHFLKQPTLVASGKVLDGDLALIEQSFGKLNCLNLEDDSKSISDYRPEKRLFIEKEDSLQSSIRIGKTALQKDHPDYLKTLVVNEILGGYFGSRLMKNIREEKGFTYGVYSNIMNLNKAALQIIGTDVKKEFRDQTIDEVFKEINKLNTELISEDELETVRNYMQGSFLSSINTPFSLADKFKSIHFHGLDYSYYDQYLNTVNTITREEILEKAQQHFDADSYSVVIVG